MRGAAIGAATAALTFGIAHGAGGGPIFGGGFLGNVAKGAAKALVGGGASEVSGGEFVDGVIGTVAGDLFGGVASSVSSSDNIGGVLARTLTAAAVGGTVAALSGGSFANGAISAAFSHLFNDELTRGYFQRRRNNANAAGKKHIHVEETWVMNTMDEYYKEGMAIRNNGGISWDNLRFNADSDEFYRDYDLSANPPSKYLPTRGPGGLFGKEFIINPSGTEPTLRGLTGFVYENQEINYFVVGMWARLKDLSRTQAGTIFNLRMTQKSATSVDFYKYARPKHMRTWYDRGYNYADGRLASGK